MKATNQAIAGGKGSVKCEGCMKMAWSLAVIAAASVGLPGAVGCARHLLVGYLGVVYLLWLPLTKP